MAKKEHMDDIILDLTIKFHNTYETLANDFNYKTREDTKDFNIHSNNGKLMFATVEQCMLPLLFELETFKDRQNKIKKNIEKFINTDNYDPEVVKNNYKKLIEILNMESDVDGK